MMLRILLDGCVHFVGRRMLGSYDRYYQLLQRRRRAIIDTVLQPLDLGHQIDRSFGTEASQRALERVDERANVQAIDGRRQAIDERQGLTVTGGTVE